MGTFLFFVLISPKGFSQQKVVFDDYDFSFQIPNDAEIEEKSNDYLSASNGNIEIIINVIDNGESFIEYSQSKTFELGINIDKSSYITHLKGFNAMKLEGQIDDMNHIIVYLNDGKYNFFIDILWHFEEGYNEALALINSIK